MSEKIGRRAGGTKGSRTKWGEATKTTSSPKMENGRDAEGGGSRRTGGGNGNIRSKTSGNQHHPERTTCPHLRPNQNRFAQLQAQQAFVDSIPICIARICVAALRLPNRYARRYASRRYGPIFFVVPLGRSHLSTLRYLVFLPAHSSFSYIFCLKFRGNFAVFSSRFLIQKGGAKDSNSFGVHRETQAISVQKLFTPIKN